MSASPSSTQAPPGPAPSRRLPPPCWSHEETVALIDTYCEKWYSLRRGNLRAPHWQEVADSVAARCPLSSGNPPKPSVQCRHKMEKLRKRYRAEIQRAAATPKGHRYSSAWVHFTRMDSMEKGSSVAVPIKSVQIDDNEDEEDEDHDDLEDLYPRIPKNESMSNGIGGASRCRIKIPDRSNIPPSGAKVYGRFDEIGNRNTISNPNYGSTRVSRDCNMGRSGLGKKREEDPVAEMVAAIRILGDGFVRMERMKMEMAREVEAMRMEMEIKRTEMILESQQRIVEAFADGFSDRNNKRAKRMPTPES